jgi:hypothetical protein
MYSHANTTDTHNHRNDQRKSRHQLAEMSIAGHLTQEQTNRDIHNDGHHGVGAWEAGIAGDVRQMRYN